MCAGCVSSSSSRTQQCFWAASLQPISTSCWTEKLLITSVSACTGAVCSSLGWALPAFPLCFLPQYRHWPNHPLIHCFSLYLKKILWLSCSQSDPWCCRDKPPNCFFCFIFFLFFWVSHWAGMLLSWGRCQSHPQHLWNQFKPLPSKALPVLWLHSRTGEAEGRRVGVRAFGAAPGQEFLAFPWPRAQDPALEQNPLFQVGFYPKPDLELISEPMKQLNTQSWCCQWNIVKDFSSPRWAVVDIEGAAVIVLQRALWFLSQRCLSKIFLQPRDAWRWLHV